MTMFARLIAAVSLLFVTGASAHALHDDHNAESSPVLIEGAWIRPTGQRTNSTAAYMSVTNKSSNAITLLGVSSAAAKMVMLHETVVDENGVARMQHKHHLAIPAGDTATLTPGGYHVMLVDLANPLNDGDVVMLTLEFADMAPVTLPVEVGRPAP